MEAILSKLSLLEGEVSKRKRNAVVALKSLYMKRTLLSYAYHEVCKDIEI